MFLILCSGCFGHLHVASEGAVFGDPRGTSRQKVLLKLVTQTQVLNEERRHDTPEKLATGLLLLLFSPSELSRGN